ncbi:LysR family transcriptional regulator [Methylocella sp.]|uniref:LysR family transcriptional regulator n=1 Tax=Methylocella sp. TaxID=1978226 RepID=UPI003784A326
MDLRTLRAFVETVRAGGFSAAAKTLNASQPTVSKAVKQLEDELGVVLIDRLGHRARPTSAGDILYRRALAMLALRDDAVAELDELRGLKRGVLRLGLPPIGSALLFAPLFASFRARYPGVDIRLAETGSKRLEEMLAAGEIDLAAVLLPVSDDFEWQEVRDDPLAAILPQGHALAGRAGVGLPQLKDAPFILFESGFAINHMILDACARHGFTPTIAARSAQIDFVVELVAAGLGVAFLPRLMAAERDGTRAVLLDEPGTQWRMALAWRSGGYLPAAARAWLDLARGHKVAEHA